MRVSLAGAGGVWCPVPGGSGCDAVWRRRLQPRAEDLDLGGVPVAGAVAAPVLSEKRESLAVAWPTMSLFVMP